jgi:hypothetical protein
LYSLAHGLSAVAARLQAEDAAALTAQAATTLAQAIKETKDPGASYSLAAGLFLVAARMKGPDATALTAQAATALVQAMKENKEAWHQHHLAQGLSVVAAGIEAKDAAQAATILVQLMKDTKDPDVLSMLAQALSAVAARMEAKEATTILVQAMKYTDDPSALHQLAQGLCAVSPADIPSRSAMAASAVAVPAGAGQPFTALASLIPAAELPPCRLCTQQLVELLKMPACIGEVRRVILDQLGNRYRRRFADVWEFVRFAKERLPDVDLTSPPQRPEPAALAR